jgi:hypothetical protein
MTKKICFLITSFALLSCAAPSSKEEKGQDTKEEATKVEATASSPTTLFPLAEAESILGERAFLKDSSTNKNADVTIVQCAYAANDTDKKTGKLGVIYFFAEEYSTPEAAHKSYADIREANKQNGIKDIDTLGDEAYFHSDNENFYYIMVRKGTKGFRIKLNKITATSSLDAFRIAAKNITERL